MEYPERKEDLEKIEELKKRLPVTSGKLDNKVGVRK